MFLKSYFKPVHIIIYTFKTVYSAGTDERFHYLLFGKPRNCNCLVLERSIGNSVLKDVHIFFGINRKKNTIYIKKNQVSITEGHISSKHTHFVDTARKVDAQTLSRLDVLGLMCDVHTYRENINISGLM